LHSALRKAEPEASVEQRVGWVRQLLDAMYFLHVNCVIHRDLKPHNVMLTKVVTDEGELQVVKLIDFGSAKFVEMTRTERGSSSAAATGGTARYAAPPRDSDSGSAPARDRRLRHADDVWSLGVIIGEVFLREAPYSACKDEVAVLLAQVKGVLPHNLDKLREMSPRLRHLVELCTQQQPEKRPSISAICHALWPQVRNGLVCG
jgi:serine/threonine protein kinase